LDLDLIVALDVSSEVAGVGSPSDAEVAPSDSGLDSEIGAVSPSGTEDASSSSFIESKKSWNISVG
jgi:hypothetical protein